MGQCKEHYAAKPMGADSTLRVGIAIAGFLPTTAGSITITDADGTVLVATMTMTVGQFIRIPLFFRTSAGGDVTLSGGGAGTLFT